MSIGIVMGIGCRDADAEEAFLESFEQALPHLETVDGLEESLPAKVAGAERRYLIYSVWRDEEAVDTWLENPRYQEIRDRASDENFTEVWSRRWSPTRERHF